MLVAVDVFITGSHVGQLKISLIVVSQLELRRLASIKHCCKFLEYRLIEPYEPTELDGVYMGQRVKVTHAGRIHSELALDDETYVVQMYPATVM